MTKIISKMGRLTKRSKLGDHRFHTARQVSMGNVEHHERRLDSPRTALMKWIMKRNSMILMKLKESSYLVRLDMGTRIG